MADADAAAVHARGPPAFRLRAYRSLAYALAATAGPAGVVFESTGAEPRPRVSVRPRSVLATVHADPFGAAGAFEEIAVPRAPEPPPGWAERHFALVPFASPDRWPWSRPTAIGDANRGATDTPPDGWFGSQTFWVRRASGDLAIARRVCVAAASGERLDELEVRIATSAAARWADATGVPAGTRPLRRAARIDWRRGALGRLPPDAWLFRTPEGVARTAEALPGETATEASSAEHRVVFGASGAGKTTYLADGACRAIVSGEEVVAIDLHGDLAPAIVTRLPPPARARVIVVDASDGPVPGIAALAPAGVDPERAAAQLVTALKRLTPDGTDVYWGFRLERIFDTFVRLVQEYDGSLLDLYGLLTDPRRREAARWGTRREDLANFLEELGPVLKRNPEFLWSAATRLSKVVLVPALAELLAPRDGGLEVEELLRCGRSLLVRLPIAHLGPESASFAATLVLGRLYLGRVARGMDPGPSAPMRLVLDEVHSFPPRLITEILTEGRKFGVRALLATQYPERLAPETRAAAAGSLSGCVAFRVPRATASEVGAWLGLSPSEALEVLPTLATGRAVAIDPDLGRLIALPPVGPTPDTAPAYAREVERTRSEFSGPVRSAGGRADDSLATERLLLAVLGAEEEGRPLPPERVVATAFGLPGEPVDLARLVDRWPTLVRRGWVSLSGAGARLTSAAEEALGIGAPTGATRESGEHRALLMRAFRIFARHGIRLEIVRQGRYDTTLPDARYRQLPPGALRGTPRDLAEAIERARTHWAWRYFGGRDVEVEAEVSGARHAERIRRGWRKAEARGAFALFVVGDAHRARRVRGTLCALGIGPDRARVWTLASGTVPGPDPLPSTNG